MFFLKDATIAAVLIACLAGCSQPDRTAAGRSLSDTAVSQPAKMLPTAAPDIVFAAMEYDLGRMQPGTQKTAVFEFINAGDQDLKLEYIRTCCGLARETGMLLPLSKARAADGLGSRQGYIALMG